MLWVLIRIASEAILMSTHNIGFYEDLTKIIFELSSNTHLISTADPCDCTAWFVYDLVGNPGSMFSRKAHI